jgi:hypothetical protein
MYYLCGGGGVGEQGAEDDIQTARAEVTGGWKMY